jgi:FdhD protein/molybdopterin-guanine dinucleotide biosynthesis protein A/molybdopterin-guanine dinucleotide biosynthesis protein
MFRFVLLDPSNSHSDITLAILAGGASQRMGRPKAGMTLSGKPVLEYLLQRLAWPGPTLLVTAPGREHPPACELFDREAVDPVAGQGPLRGVLTALQNSSTSRVLVLTVDMPCLLPEHLDWLIGRATAFPDCRGIMLRRAIKGVSQIEPFPFLCRVDAAEIISDRLTNGPWSVHSLAEVSGFFVEAAPTDWPDTVWTNLNTPQDLESLVSFRPAPRP